METSLHGQASTINNLLKHLPPSIATSLGHLYQERKNLQ